MRCLITGASGFIGSHLAEALSKRGDEVLCLVRKSSKLRWLKDVNPRYFYGEVSQKDSLREAVRAADCIYHLASLTKAVRPQDYYRINAEGTRNLLEVCAEENPRLKKIIIVSSLAAAGPSPAGAPIAEDSPPAPITDYGRSKLRQEGIAREFISRLPIAIVRPPAVYGPRDHDIYFYFKMIKKGAAFFAGSEDPVVSIVYAPDLAKALIAVADCSKSPGEIYYAANEQPHRISDFCLLIAAALGVKKFRTFRFPLAVAQIVALIAEVAAHLTKKPALLNRQKILESRQPAWICSVDKIRRDTGFSCPTPIEIGLIQTAEWYRQNGWL